MADNIKNRAEEFKKDFKSLSGNDPITTIYAWEAPNRIALKRSRLYYLLVAFLAMIIIVFAALTRDFILIVVTIAALILVYVNSYIPPKLVSHEITSKGIRSGQQLHVWKNIKGFWISRRAGHLMLILDLVDEIKPNRVILLLGTGDPIRIVKELVEKSVYFNRKQTGEDFINIFTLGEYLPITAWIEPSKSE